MSWGSTPLENVATVVNGGTPKTRVTEFWDGENQWITPAEMGKLQTPFIGATARTLTDLGISKSSASILPAYSVILSTRAPIGHLAINTVPMATNQGCRGIIPGENLHYKFLYYFLLAEKQQLNDLGTGATFKELSASKLKSVRLPLPPLDEQKRIVQILDKSFEAIDKAIENTEQNLANARELFESELNAIFEKGTVEFFTTKLGNEDLTQIIDGDRGRHYPKKANFMNKGHCLFLNTKNVRPNGFNFEELMFIDAERDSLLRKGKLQRRDVLLTTRGTIGNIALYDAGVPFDHIRINSGMLIFRPNETKITSEYLFEFFRSSAMKKQIAEHVSGAAQPQLPIKTLVKFDIQVPKDIADQEEIVKKLNRLETWSQKLLRHQESKLTLLRTLKQSILQKAFNGELTADINKDDKVA